MECAKDFYRQIRKLEQQGTGCALTVLDGEAAGEKAVVSNGKIVWDSNRTGFFRECRREAEKISGEGIFALHGRQVYAERIGSARTLVVCGAGHVGTAVVRIAKMTGFYTICIDDRPSFVNDARRAGADEAVCSEFAEALAQIPGGPDTSFVIVTRGHRWDRDCLGIIAGKPHAYIGLMGSKRRIAALKNELREAGVPGEVLDQVHAPIGLSIGAETPEEIAVSILAELIQVNHETRRPAGYPREILSALLNSGDGPDHGEPVLATIIRKKGSAPRAVGTKMLIFPDGTCVGTIGGGCAEAEVIRRGRRLLLAPQPQPVVQHVDLTGEGTAEEGMACGGIIDVLLERIRDGGVSRRKTGAVIVAAGMSSRMKDLKQMMKIGGMTMTERIVDSFKRAGITDIVVVTGYQAERVEDSVRRFGVTFVRNGNYGTTQMFDSAKLGLSCLRDRCESVLFCPADVPLFSDGTLKQLLSAEGRLIIPVCGGRNGHPIRIDASLIPAILEYRGEGGLKGALNSLEPEPVRLDVEDAGVVMDADTGEDYRRLVEFYNDRS